MLISTLLGIVLFTSSRISGETPAQPQDATRGLAFEKTQSPAVTEEQDWRWLVYLLRELNGRYWKKWTAEKDGEYFVAMSLEIAMHSERAIQAAADIFCADREPPGAWERGATLALVEWTLFAFPSDLPYRIYVSDGRLRFRGYFQPLVGGTGAAGNRLAQEKYDELKKNPGLRKLQDFEKQRMSDLDRELKWQRFLRSATEPRGPKVSLGSVALL